MGLKSGPALAIKTAVTAVLPVVALRIATATVDSAGASYPIYMFAWIFSFPIAAIYFCVSLVKNTKARRQDPQLYAQELFSERVFREACSWGWAGVPVGAAVFLFLEAASSGSGVSGGGAFAIVPVGIVVFAGIAAVGAVEAVSPPVAGRDAGWLATRPKALWTFLTAPRPVRK